MDTGEYAIVPVIAHVLNQLVARNDKLPFDKSQVTLFHGLKAPGISVCSYLERIVKYSPCSAECFVLALIYVDRLLQREPRFLLCSLNVHRVLLAAVMAGAKFFDDAAYNNSYYARVGGVPAAELNAIELDFLFRLNFHLVVTPDVFLRYHAELLRHAPPLESSITPALDLPTAAEIICTSSAPATTAAAATITVSVTAPIPTPLQQAGVSSVGTRVASPTLLKAAWRLMVEEEVQRKRLPVSIVRRASELLDEAQMRRSQAAVSPNLLRGVCERLRTENPLTLSPSLTARAGALRVEDLRATIGFSSFVACHTAA